MPRCFCCSTGEPCNSQGVKDKDVCSRQSSHYRHSEVLKEHWCQGHLLILHLYLTLSMVPCFVRNEFPVSSHQDIHLLPSTLCACLSLHRTTPQTRWGLKCFAFACASPSTKNTHIFLLTREAPMCPYPGVPPYDCLTAYVLHLWTPGLCISDFTAPFAQCFVISLPGDCELCGEQGPSLRIPSTWTSVWHTVGDPEMLTYLKNVFYFK